MRRGWEALARQAIRSCLYLHEAAGLWQDAAVQFPRLHSLADGLAVLLAAVPAALGQGNFYSLTDLGPVGAPADRPAALNQHGIAVGVRSVPARDGTPLSRAFIFTNASFELGPPGTLTFASDVNDLGDTVGWSRLPQANGRQVERAVLWQKGNHIELGTLGGATSRAFGINERAEITGAAQTTNGAFHAFLWRQGKLHDLGTLGGRNSYGHAVNSAFDVAGVAETTQQVRHAFLHTGGQMRDLGTLGGVLSQANGLNEAGDVVGTAQNATGQSRAFLHAKGKMADLGTLGGQAAFANAINNRQQVVGAAQLATGETRAFLWREKKMWDLSGFLPPSSGWFLLEATDINDAGQILCLARTKHGQVRLVRLNPPGR
jgi:probable HAF family extracellular repeat protein